MAGKEWKAIVWPGSFRTIRESLIDELVDLPGLLYICSTLERKLGGKSALCEMDLLEGRHLLGAFKQFEMRLNSWHEGVKKHRGSALYWEQSSSNPVSLLN